MARLARVLCNDTAYHVTQRGNARQSVFHSDQDRSVYLDLLRTQCRVQQLALAGYCLMSNHVHLIVIPRRTSSLPLALKHIHGRYAAYYNALHASSGHVWQGRYYSCPLDEPHFWAALRYVELNPARALMVDDPCDYPWSSAAVHCGRAQDHGLDMKLFTDMWTPVAWQEYLNQGGVAEETEAIRGNTHTGRPLGDVNFVSRIEEALHRRLAPSKGGRPRKKRPDELQQHLSFTEH
jgi:putative transposase